VGSAVDIYIYGVVREWRIDQFYARTQLSVLISCMQYVSVCIDGHFYRKACRAQQFMCCFYRRGILQQYKL
jgi:hypothetical protein